MYTLKIQRGGSYATSDRMNQRLTMFRHIENGLTTERIDDHVAITKTARQIRRIRFLKP